MSKRDDLVPFGRYKAERWTRASDYIPGAEGQQLLALPSPDLPDERRRVNRLGIWLPVLALALLAGLLWISGALDRSVGDSTVQSDQVSPLVQADGGATSSKGVVFGLCDQGGGTNCIVDGDSFYMGGKGIRVAGIEAPKTHSAACDGEALLGWAAAERLQSILNSGTVTLAPIAAAQDRNGRLMRTVKVDGRDVGQALLAAGFARPSAVGGNWCAAAAGS